MPFSEALRLLKEGKRVRRLSWKEIEFIFLVNSSSFKVSRPPLLGIYEEGTEVSYHSHIDAKTVAGYVVPWGATQADLLEEDWEEWN